MSTEITDVLLNMVQALSWPDDYEQRKVDRYEDGLGCISTARMHDGIKPFETTVVHVEYNGGAAVIVESYDTEDEARTGHQRWVKLMTSDHPPEVLADCGNCAISRWLQENGSPMRYPRRPIITKTE